MLGFICYNSLKKIRGKRGCFMESISAKDRAILRQTAAKQAELAHTPKNLQHIEEWKAHNDFRGQRPMIHLELWTFQQELIEPLLRCEGEAAREIERSLICSFANQELLDDDKITPNYVPVGWHTHFIPFGLEENVTRIDGGLGHHFDPVIEDLEEDWGKLNPSRWGVDRPATLAHKARLEELLGDILPVKLTMNCLYSVPTQKLVHLMGMETLLVSLYDYPELFLQLMERYADDTIAHYRWLEQEGLLLPTAGDESLGQGTLCYTTELPASAEAAGRSLTTKDVWGFMDSQETVGVSPAMFEEFIFPAYHRIAEQYGLLSYGCCEPVHSIWDSCISKLDHLRKVSISPWCDEDFMGERLQGRRCIYQRKPSPNLLGVDKVLDEEAVQAHIRKTMQAARGCTVELTQRDVYTIHNNPAKARRYVELLREESTR